MKTWPILLVLLIEPALAENWMSELAMMQAFKGTTLLGEYEDGQ
jgi:hypothetical protein